MRDESIRAQVRESIITSVLAEVTSTCRVLAMDDAEEAATLRETATQMQERAAALHSSPLPYDVTYGVSFAEDGDTLVLVRATADPRRPWEPTGQLLAHGLKSTTAEVAAWLSEAFAAAEGEAAGYGSYDLVESLRRAAQLMSARADQLDREGWD